MLPILSVDLFEFTSYMRYLLIHKILDIQIVHCMDMALLNIKEKCLFLI